MRQNTSTSPRRRVDDEHVDAVRVARAEVVDVLAEGLWSLIIAGRWPATAGGAEGPSIRLLAAANLWKTLGFDSCLPRRTTPPWL